MNRYTKRAIVAAVAVTLVAAIVEVPSASAGSVPALCGLIGTTPDSSRGGVPGTFTLDACVDGKNIVLHNQLSTPIHLHLSGSATSMVTDETTHTPAGDAVRAQSSDEYLLLPGDRVHIPIGDAAADVLVGPSDVSFLWDVAQIVGAFNIVGLLSIENMLAQIRIDLENDYLRYTTCLSKVTTSLGRQLCRAALSARAAWDIEWDVVTNLPLSGPARRSVAAALRVLARKVVGSLVSGAVDPAFPLVSQTTLHQAAFSFAITPTDLPDAVAGDAYAQTLRAEGGSEPYSWSLLPGSSLDGLILNSGTGTLTGTPTSSGTYELGVQVTDSHGRATSRSYSLTVTDRASPSTTVPQTLYFTGYDALAQPMPAWSDTNTLTASPASPAPGDTVTVTWTSTNGPPNGPLPGAWNTAGGLPVSIVVAVTGATTGGITLSTAPGAYPAGAVPPNGGPFGPVNASGTFTAGPTPGALHYTFVEAIAYSTCWLDTPPPQPDHDGRGCPGVPQPILN